MIIYKRSILTNKIFDAYELEEKLSDKMYIAKVIVGIPAEIGVLKTINIENCAGYYISNHIDEFNKLNNK